MNCYLQSAYVAIEKAVDDMNEEQMRRHPEGKWCVAEILEHLALAFGSTNKLMTKCLDAGAPQARGQTLREKIIVFTVCKVGYIPEGRKAPKHVVPTGAMTPSEARRLILQNLATMDDAIEKCAQKFGTRIKVADHPILGPLTVDGWRKFHLTHTLHHVKQIKRLRAASPAQPSSVTGAAGQSRA